VHADPADLIVSGISYALPASADRLHIFRNLYPIEGFETEKKLFAAVFLAFCAFLAFVAIVRHWRSRAGYSGGDTGDRVAG